MDPEKTVAKSVGDVHECWCAYYNLTFVLLGKILLPYVKLIYYWPAYYNSDEMLDKSVNAH